MGGRMLLVVALLCVSMPARGQQDDWMQQALRAMQVGAQIRALQEGSSTLEAAQRYIRQQTELTEAKTRLLEAQITQLQQLEEAQKSRPLAASAGNAPPSQEEVAVRARQVQIVMGIFATVHPDWKEYEDRMMRVATKAAPGPEATMFEYVEVL